MSEKVTAERVAAETYVEPERVGEMSARQFRRLIKATRETYDEWLVIVNERGPSTQAIQHLHSAAIQFESLQRVESAYFRWPNEGGA